MQRRPLTHSNSLASSTEGKFLPNSHARIAQHLSSAEAVRQRKAAYERVETQLGTRDTSILPRCYRSLDREQAYDEGLRMGSVAFRDGLEHGHDFFVKETPRGILANAR